MTTWHWVLIAGVAVTFYAYAVYPILIVVVSDGSTDGTDALVAEYSHLGVELLRHTPRVGKTEVENFAMTALTGEIIVNTDASVALAPDAVWRLVAALSDPGVGVSSGRDISVAAWTYTKWEAEWSRCTSAYWRGFGLARQSEPLLGGAID